MSWTTLNDIATIQGWYEPSKLTGLSDSDLISTQTDSSGLHRDVTAVGGSRPTYKTNILNGLPVSRWAATGNIMSSAGYALSGVEMSCCAVVNLSALQNYNSIVSVDEQTPPSGAPSVFGVYGLANGTGYMEQGATYRGHANMFAAGAWHIVTCLYQSGYIQVRCDGKELIENDRTIALPAAKTVTAYTHLGASGYGGAIRGDLAALVLWQETSLRESIWIEGYLSHRFALTLDHGHLFHEAAPQFAPATYNAAGGSRLINGGLVRGQVL